MSHADSNLPLQGITENKSYPDWVMGIALAMILASVLPMPVVFLLRRFQILKVDLDIHQGSIRRNETTASTKEMIDEDDVSSMLSFPPFFLLSVFSQQCHVTWQKKSHRQTHPHLFILSVSVLPFGEKLFFSHLS